MGKPLLHTAELYNAAKDRPFSPSFMTLGRGKRMVRNGTSLQLGFRKSTILSVIEALSDDALQMQMWLVLAWSTLIHISMRSCSNTRKFVPFGNIVDNLMKQYGIRTSERMLRRRCQQWDMPLTFVHVNDEEEEVIRDKIEIYITQCGVL